MMRDYRRRRAVTAIIGAAIVFSILFSSVFAYFVVLTDNLHDYQLTALQKASSDSSKDLESFTMSTQLTNGNIGFSINNTGGLTVKIVGLFLKNLTTTTYISSSSSGVSPPLPIFSNPNTGSPLVDTGIVPASGQVYDMTAVSSQGTIATDTFPQAASSTIDEVATVVGWVTLEFSSLRWAIWTENDIPSNVTWNAGPDIAVGNPIVWKGSFTNHFSQDIYLSENTLISTFRSTDDEMDIGGDDTKLYWFFMVDPTDFGQYTPNHSLVIPAGGEKELMFGTVIKGGAVQFVDTDKCNKEEEPTGSCVQYDNDGKTKGQYLVFMVIYGRWGSPTGDFYGQNIPFAGVIVS